jgi:protein-S-isoprenylcysteine O-methyltransferase Ste14
VAAGLVPWLLTAWRFEELLRHWAALRVAGAVLLVAGAAAVVHAFARFAGEGLGTPAPVAPPKRLVVGGAYRYVRNPMYVAVATAIVGEALLLGQRVLFVYAAAFIAVVASFVRLYEEPTLARRFGPEYEAYKRAVPAWWPRRRLWSP